MGRPQSSFELSLVSVSYWNKTWDNIILFALPKINPVKWCSQFQEFVRFGGNICLRTSSIQPTPVTQNVKASITLHLTYYSRHLQEPERLIIASIVSVRIQHLIVRCWIHHYVNVLSMPISMSSLVAIALRNWIQLCFCQVKQP